MGAFDGTMMLVSGTSDTGRALARRVAEAGGTVAFTYYHADAVAEELLEDLPGEDHACWQCDVADRAEVEAVTDAVFDGFDVDALVYTVGVIEADAIQDLAADSWRRHLDGNVTGAFNVVQAVAPRLADRGSGAIVALSASAGVLRSTELAAYDASKRALEAFIAEAAREFGPEGVRANVVAPGFIRDPDALPAERRESLLDQQPYKQLTTPQAVADACLFLCSDATTITGVVLPVDSGLAL